jgi:hypothetical protein
MNPAILIEQDHIYFGRGHRLTVTVKHPLTGAGVTGLSGITGRLSSTKPTDADKDGTLITSCEGTLVATTVAGQYSVNLDESVVDPGIDEGVAYVWEIIDGPNIYQVTRLTVVRP